MSIIRKFNPFTGEFDYVSDVEDTILNFKPAVANQASLPLSGNSINDARIANDTHHLYVWDGTQWVDKGDILDVDWSSIANKPSSSVANIDDAVGKRHTQGTDQKLDDGGANEVTVANVKDAVDKKHTQDTDTTLQKSQNILAPSQTDDSESAISLYGNIYIAQTFVADKTGTLDSVAISLARHGDLAEVDDLIVEIQEVSGGKPSGVILGTDTISKNDIIAEEEPTAPEIETATFTGVNVTAGVAYAIVVYHKNNGGSSSHSFIPYDKSGNPYANGLEAYSDDAGSSWNISILSTRDLYFVVTITGVQGTEKVDVIIDGALQRDLDANSNKITNLKVPSGNGDAIRQTTKITESNLEDTQDKKHEHSNKATLDTYTQTEANLADAVGKKHTQNSDTQLDDGVIEIEATDETKISKGAGFATEVANTVASGGTATIDWREGNKQKLTVSENVTVSFTDPSNPCSLILRIIQSGAGNTTALPAGIKWAGGVAPTLSNGDGEVDIVSLYFDGTNYWGTYVINLS